MSLKIMNPDLEEQIKILKKDIINIDNQVNSKQKKRKKIIKFTSDVISNFIASGIISYVIIQIEKNYFGIEKISNIYNFFIVFFLFTSALFISIKTHLNSFADK